MHAAVLSPILPLLSIPGCLFLFLQSPWKAGAVPSGLASGGILLTLHREQESKIKQKYIFLFFLVSASEDIFIYKMDGRQGFVQEKHWALWLVVAGDVPGSEAEWEWRLIWKSKSSEGTLSGTD